MLPVIRVEQQETQFDWPEGSSARFWILQPDESHVPNHPPWTHPREDPGVWPLLQRVVAKVRDCPDPTFIAVPELTISPTLIPDLRTLIQALPSHVVLVAGMGHLTREECDAIEPGISGGCGAGSDGSRWLHDWRAGAWANGAIVGVDGRSFLEAKRGPSPFEQRFDCHHPHRLVRLFKGRQRTFSVVICSEMQDDQPDELADCLRAAHPDVVFWLQHNPKPRHELLQRRLATFFKRIGDHPVIVCANKRKVGQRSSYGASAIAAPGACFSSNKYRMTRPGWVTEPIANSAAARAVLLRYDAPALLVRTLHPADVPATASFEEKAGFLDQVIAYDESAEPLGEASDTLRALFDAGERRLPENQAAERARAVLPEQLRSVRDEFARSSDCLLHFLDRAFRQDRTGRHTRGESHPTAAACDCWEHRRDFDSLFQRSDEVIELLLAVAALRSIPEAKPTVRDKSEFNVDLNVAGGQRQLLLLRDTDVSAIQRHLGSLPSLHGEVHAIALEARPSSSIREVRANARPAKRLRANAAREAEASVLWGDEFWEAVPDGTLETRIRDLYEGVHDGNPGGGAAAA